MKNDSIVVSFPTDDHESGTVNFVFTGQQWGLKDKTLPPPSKTCAGCNNTFFAPLFLKCGEVRNDNYFWLLDDPLCVDCKPRSKIPIHLDARGKLRTKIVLRDERGEPYRWGDVSTSRWRAMPKIGLRRMQPTGNIIRCQPRSDRRHALDGQPYAR